MKNIKDFESSAGAIFERLFAAFPTPTSLNFILMSGHTDEDIDEFGRPPASTQFISDTAKWLTHEGFIRADSTHILYFQGAVLTTKGLSALNQRIDAIDPRVSLGEKLKEAAISGSRALVGNIVQAVISATITP